MPAMKKEVYDILKKKLEDEQRKIKSNIYSNRYAMKRLVTEQTHLKRELAAIGQLISSMEVK
jgi:hypothetical protein